MTRHVVLYALAASLIVTPAGWAGLDQSKKPADAYPSEVASSWFDTLYDVVKAEKTPPPPAARDPGPRGT